MTIAQFAELAEAIRLNRKHFSRKAIITLGLYCFNQNKQFNFDKWSKSIEKKRIK